MKWYFLIVIFILISGFCYAQIEISLVKEELTNKETLQTNLTVLEEPFESLSPSNFYIDDIKTPLILNRINDFYYGYIELSELSIGEHSFQVKTKYIENGILIEKEFEKKFVIKETDYPVITLNPGFLKLDTKEYDPYFKIYLKNNGDQEVNLGIYENADFLYPSRTTITIQPQQTNYFYVYTNLKNKEITETILEIKNDNQNYFLPIIPIKIQEENKTQEEQPQGENITEGRLSFVSSLQSLTRILNEDQSIKATIKVRNEINKTLNNITFYMTGNLAEIIELDLTSINLDYLEEKTQTIWINKKKNAEGYYSGNLIIESKEGHKDEFPILLTFSPEEEVKPIEQEEIDLGVSEDNEGLLEDIIKPVNITKKTPEKKEKKYSTVLLVIIVILIVAVVFLLLSKSKKETYKDYLTKIKR